MFRRWLGGGIVVAGVAAVCWPGHPARALRAPAKRALVLTQTAGFRHSSIPVAAAQVASMGEISGGWQVTARADTAAEVAEAITARRLKDVDLVFFVNTTGNLAFTPEGKKAFYDWVGAGGAVVGIHSASDTFHGDPDYLNLVRGEFMTHGAQVKVTVYNQDPRHPACRYLPASFEIYDEIYEFKNWSRDRVHMLLSMKKHPQRDLEGDFPVAWTNRVGQGRMFYTSLGHREDIYDNTTYLAHLQGGVEWALGLKPGDDTPGNPIR